MVTRREYRQARGTLAALRELLRALPRTTWQRTVRRMRDWQAVAAGYCNDCPWSPIPGDGRGYFYWRCALRRNHDSPHRYRNYTWKPGERVAYDPLPDYPQQPHERPMVLTRRQSRQRELARAGGPS